MNLTGRFGKKTSYSINGLSEGAGGEGIIRPSFIGPLKLKVAAPALSHHYVVRLNPLRVLITSSNQKPKKATLSGDLFWFFGGGGGNCTYTITY